MEAFGMSQIRPIYVINVDLAGSKVHLNPEVFNDNWCNLDKTHVRSSGGRIEVNGQEAEDYLAGRRPLIFEGRTFKTPERCENCSKKCKQKAHGDISL
jgi:hypothetical protein